jgi:8-oxo-dGTP pyrophosphatase MutT (NUDIX family)
MFTISNTAELNGDQHEFTFYETDSLKGYKPLTQSYGLCYTEDKKFVVGKRPSRPNYNPSGGTIEKGETPEETLIREVDEELSLEVIKYKLIGVQKATNLRTNKTVYQVRYACIVKLKELTPDPDNGELWERILVNPNEVNKYLNWHEVGEYLEKKSYDMLFK